MQVEAPLKASLANILGLCRAEKLTFLHVSHFAVKGLRGNFCQRIALSEKDLGARLLVKSVLWRGFTAVPSGHRFMTIGLRKIMQGTDEICKTRSCL